MLLVFHWMSCIDETEQLLVEVRIVFQLARMKALVMMDLLSWTEQYDLDLDFDGYFEYLALFQCCKNMANCPTSMTMLLSLDCS